ncbi:hypothetical protein DESPIG_01400 [Desulfovibrio piger ATCC 29098]|uniref:Uncharacterized protein n=1 Tax=Desulfovibrio piger ATCC 29098 TaxID=411464 RepID=B6WTJ5_9BACT|nr:hypothetical protein DESPIG_01400 [Desulfovibrio piger ATCC 29098]
MWATPFLMMGTAFRAGRLRKSCVTKGFLLPGKSGPGLLYPLPLVTGCSMFDSSHSRTIYMFSFLNQRKNF